MTINEALPQAFKHIFGPGYKEIIEAYTIPLTHNETLNVRNATDKDGSVMPGYFVAEWFDSKGGSIAVHWLGVEP